MLTAALAGKEYNPNKPKTGARAAPKAPQKSGFENFQASNSNKDAAPSVAGGGPAGAASRRDFDNALFHYSQAQSAYAMRWKCTVAR